MHSILKKYDDFVVVSRDLSNVSGFTLTGLMHNEMHFLPPFLAHYRALGVKRFIFVNDRSTDGTHEYLSAQDDVMVLKSARKYGDKIPAEDADALGLPHQRVELIWRMLLSEKFSSEKWSLHLDADEFLALPDGMLISDLAAKLDPEDGRAVWSVMIEMYPATLADLDAMENDETINLAKTWYFDGQQHLRLRESNFPKTVYPGGRARLLAKFGLNKKTSVMKERAKRLLGRPLTIYSTIRKPILLHWSAGDRFDSAHAVSAQMSKKVLLPLCHYKFNGPVHERIYRASTTANNTQDGRSYKDLKRLLDAIEQGDGSFLYPKSVHFTGFEDFQRTGNAVGVI